jgi:Uri superfamily endonuclease
VKGTYVLVLHCMRPFRLKMGRLGCANMTNGYYIYTGSALGTGAVSLEGRLRRHSQRKKKVNWHIDYLTSDTRCEVKAAVVVRSAKRLECIINRAVMRELDAHPLLARAGSSDCKCEGHLAKVGPSIRSRDILPMARAVCRKFAKSVGYAFFPDPAQEQQSAQLP